ncbi:respiratory nitrate reductase subunit gamma [Streptomyces sp. WI03-4A]|uniref:respiratory nitrate reductase subunit gamma n=1 Tax=Streptomyces sp. WI03-4A TaxID=3028706 RepID=UPI0029AE99CC|nr:respiratory nitrate reductase subunit gamma [Streptomyces sp. WI03-4A]MDX2592136.1 respiratory nitrate reductase subunit gamma [Streptomyces sp. WI03-4A]
MTAIPEPSSPADALLRAGRFFTRRQVSPGQRAVFLEGAARVTSSTATAGATTRSVIGHVIGLLIPESWTSRAGLSEHAYHERAIALGTQLPRDRLTLVPARLTPSGARVHVHTCDEARLPVGMLRICQGLFQVA